MTIREVVRVVLGIDARLDVRARLLGYIVMLRYGGGWALIPHHSRTEDRLAVELEKHGLSLEMLDP